MRRAGLRALLVGALALVLPANGWAAPPPNDDFASAAVIGALPFSVQLDTSEA